MGHVIAATVCKRCGATTMPWNIDSKHRRCLYCGASGTNLVIVECWPVLRSEFDGAKQHDRIIVYSDRNYIFVANKAVE